MCRNHAQMNKLFELKFGSHLYGTNTENSDLDLKSIYLPTARELVLGTYKKTVTTSRPKQTNERNTKDDVDVEIFSLDRYLKLLSEGQTVALDVLFAHNEMFIAKNPSNWHVFKEIRDNKEKLLCSDLAAFIGYAQQQAQKYGLKGFRIAALEDTLKFLDTLDPWTKLDSEENFPKVYKFCYARPCYDPVPRNEYIKIVTQPNVRGADEKFLEVCEKKYSLKCFARTIREQIQFRWDQYGKRALMARENKGVDWKALSHAVRVNRQGIELLLTGNITFPRPDRELLLKIKTGQLEYNQVADIIVEGLEELRNAEKASILRKTPDQDWINDFTFDTYLKVIRGEL